MLPEFWFMFHFAWCQYHFSGGRSGVGTDYHPAPCIMYLVSCRINQGHESRS